MRQIWIEKFGPPEVVTLKQAPDPEPRPGEVRIRVEASGVDAKRRVLVDVELEARVSALEAGAKRGEGGP